MKQYPPPPEKLSQAIMMSLHDMEALRYNEKYELSLHTWHFNRGDVCVVCMAGATMANRLKAKRQETIDFKNLAQDFYKIFPDKWNSTFLAINEVRSGELKKALWYFYDTQTQDPDFLRSLEELSEDFEEWVNCDMLNPDEPFKDEQDYEMFTAAMIDIAAFLEVHGY